MKHAALALSLTLATTMLVSGCAQVPTGDVQAAQAAIENARQAQASVYAPEAWVAANDAAAKLSAELSAQEQHMALTRSYATAKALAQETKEAAQRAATAATEGKQKTRSEATDLLAQSKTEYEAATHDLANAPKGKGTAADLATLKADATPIATTLDEAQRALDAGDYMTAKTKAQSALDAAKAIRTQVEQAVKARHAA